MRLAILLVWIVVIVPATVAAGTPLHERIDELIAAKAGGKTAAALSDDAEFLRRVYLDLAGRIPAVDEARAFLADTATDKRTKVIDALLTGPAYARHMADLFHVVLMERRGDHEEWHKFLRTSFAVNKPWDTLAREILAPNADDEQTRGSAFFISKRLETYGQNPTDFPGLTRDVARLFLGQDLQCAQCHDHLFIDDYKQRDFQGLYVVYANAKVSGDKFPVVTVKPPASKLEFVSVFEAGKQATGPRIPGGSELPLPSDDSDNTGLLTSMAAEIARADNPLFVRNAANRLWSLMMGRGLIHPLDLHHSANPPSHPELLDLLAGELVNHGFDIKWMLREIALSQTYQRSSMVPPDGEPPLASLFLVANERPLSAEQLWLSVLQATGESFAMTTTDESAAALADRHKDLRDRFLKSFAAEPTEPEVDVRSTVKAALFLLNDERFLQLVDRQSGNLTDRLLNLSGPDLLTEKLYLSVLSRRPDDEELALVAAHLAANANHRESAVKQLIWALVSSAEFSMNH